MKKKCNRCSETKNIKSFQNKGNGIRRGVCTVCRNGSSRERFYYLTEELEKLSKINSNIIQRKVDGKKQRKKRDEKKRKTPKMCRGCSNYIVERKLGRFLCISCSTSRKKEIGKICKKRIDTKNRKKLKDPYIKALIRASIRKSCSISVEIPQELIELKRKQLKLFRYGKET